MHGKVQWFLKQKGHTGADSTWAPEVSLDCPRLVEASLNSQKVDKETTVQSDGGKSKKKSDSADKSRGFAG